MSNNDIPNTIKTENLSTKFLVDILVRECDIQSLPKPVLGSEAEKYVRLWKSLHGDYGVRELEIAKVTYSRLTPGEIQLLNAISMGVIKFMKQPPANVVIGSKAVEEIIPQKIEAATPSAPVVQNSSMKPDITQNSGKRKKTKKS